MTFQVPYQRNGSIAGSLSPLFPYRLNGMTWRIYTNPFRESLKLPRRMPRRLKRSFIPSGLPSKHRKAMNKVNQKIVEKRSFLFGHHLRNKKRVPSGHSPNQFISLIDGFQSDAAGSPFQDLPPLVLYSST